jgi:NADH-quinone oxidoreductase subunit M
MLWMFQRVNYGPVTNPKNEGLPDLSPREWAAIGPTLVMAIVMGILPNFFLAPMEPAVDRLVQRIHAQRPLLAEAAEGDRPMSEARR